MELRSLSYAGAASLLFCVLGSFVLSVSPCEAFSSQVMAAASASAVMSDNYKLGPEDSLLIHVKDETEVPDGPYQVALNGDLTVPEIGTTHAAGMTVAALSRALTERWRKFLIDPVVVISVAEYRSQRVSVLGEVGIPGVQQIRGRKTLYEVISDAGGLKQDAGGTIQISRLVQEGPLPLPRAALDASGRYEIGEIDVDTLMKARSPETNIPVCPNDVITIPKAELVYVLGAVRKPGGFELHEKQSISVLQALSLAEGSSPTAKTKRARISRESGPNGERVQIPLELNQLISGKQPDVLLHPNDILVIPNSAARSASYRALEAMVTTGSGIAIYHPY